MRKTLHFRILFKISVFKTFVALASAVVAMVITSKFVTDSFKCSFNRFIKLSDYMIGRISRKRMVF